MPGKDELTATIDARRAACDADLCQFVAALTSVPLASQGDADARGRKLAVIVCDADRCSSVDAMRRALESARDLYVTKCDAADFLPLIADEVKLLLGDGQSEAVVRALRIYHHAFPDRPLVAAPLEQRLSMLLTSLEHKARCLDRVRDVLLIHEARLAYRADGSLPTDERLDALLSLVPAPLLILLREE